MGRLIDADLFSDKIRKNKEYYKKGLGKDAEFAFVTSDSVLKTIENQPTAYDVDKVVEQLKTARDGYSTAQLMTATNDELVKHFIAKEKAMNLAIKIVKAGGKNDD